MTDDATKLRDILGAAGKLEVKRILDKLRNQEALKPAEMKVLEEYERQEQEREASVGQAPAEFRNARAVAEWLKSAGWKLNQSTLYAHVKDGKLRPDETGSFPLKAVQKYAAAFLSRKDTLQKLSDEDLNRRKLKCEIERIQEQTRRERLRRQIEEGKYLLRESFELELAARAAVIDTLRRNTIMSFAAEIVGLVKGDSKKVPDLIQYLLAQHEDEMNQYATVREFHVLFDSNSTQES